MDARTKAQHADRLLKDPILNEVLEAAHHELTDTAIHGDTAEDREHARSAYLGLDEIVNRLRYLASEMDMPAEEEEE